METIAVRSRAGKNSLRFLQVAVVFSVTLCLSTLPRAGAAEPEVPPDKARTHDEQVAQAVELIRGMPSWPLMPVIVNEQRWDEAVRKAADIESACRQVAEYDTAVLREAFERYQKQTDSLGLARLFWLNRYLFETPATVRRDAKHFQQLLGWRSPQAVGSWENPQPTDEFDVLWPWEKDKQGVLRFRVDLPILSYYGPPYPALERFDSYSQHFGRRKHADHPPEE